MTTQFPMRSKCPKCGREYDFLEVMSVFIRTQEDIERVKSLMNYEKSCECGEVFDMSKNKILMLDHDINISGHFSDEFIEKFVNAFKEQYKSDKI